MIFGVGTDIIEIPRVAKAAENPRFLHKYFTGAENALFAAAGKGAASAVAGNFAAKEALAKAFGTGFRGIALIELEILRLDNGAPYARLHGRAEDFARENGITAVHISISHSADNAVAFALCESFQAPVGRYVV